ncbi:unnamed protein product, partial [Laminaria digitata]
RYITLIPGENLDNILGLLGNLLVPEHLVSRVSTRVERGTTYQRVYITFVTAPQYHTRLHTAGYDVLDGIPGQSGSFSIDPNTIPAKPHTLLKTPTLEKFYW